MNNNELNTLFLQQIEQLTAQCELLMTQNQLLVEKNQQLVDLNRQLEEKNLKMREAIVEWKNYAQKLQEANKQQDQILNKLKTTEVQEQIIQGISKSLQNSWQEQSDQFFGEQKQSMQQQAEQLMKQQMILQIQPLMINLRQDHSALQMQITQLSKMLQS